jgi:acyl dehydratase
MPGSPEIYRVSAYNTAKQSENKMHDDTVAKRFGFSGGLVPGVEILAYMMHVPVAKWGHDFLERGRIDGRFVKPVYDGELTDVIGEVQGEQLAIRIESRGQLCATGSASLLGAAETVSLNGFPDTPAVATRAPVDANSYTLGKWLGTAPRTWDAAALKDYLAEVREADPIYATNGLVHPGVLQRIMNQVLVQNAILGPWIHVGSNMQLLAAAKIGDALAERAKDTANSEKKGHRFVELDAVVVANCKTPVARCQHVAIYQPREQAAA